VIETGAEIGRARAIVVWAEGETGIDGVWIEAAALVAVEAGIEEREARVADEDAIAATTTTTITITTTM